MLNDTDNGHGTYRTLVSAVISSSTPRSRCLACAWAIKGYALKTEAAWSMRRGSPMAASQLSLTKSQRFAFGMETRRVRMGRPCRCCSVACPARLMLCDTTRSPSTLSVCEPTAAEGEARAVGEGNRVEVRS